MTGAPERMHYSTEGVCIVPPRTRYAVVIATPTGAIPMPFLADVVLESLPFGGGVVSVVRDGVSLGAVIAVVCSWQLEPLDPLGDPRGTALVGLRRLFRHYPTAG